jgi:hypothetical protein
MLRGQQGDEKYAGIGFNWGYDRDDQPFAYIGTQVKNFASYVNGDLVFGTRSVVTDTAPSERMRINASGTIFCAEDGNNGDYSMYIGSVNGGGSANRYVHVQVDMSGDMYWIEAVGFDYVAKSMYGRAGGYMYNTGATYSPYSSVVHGDIVAQYQTSAGIEIVIDTGNTATGNRWGNIILRGGTDTISPNFPIEIIQYSYTSSTTRVY